MASGVVEIEGRDTKYIGAHTAHEKYEHRPSSLENICLVQFYANYDMVRRRKEYNFDSEGAAGYSATKQIRSWNEGEETPLPEIIKLGNNMGCMQLRSCPAVIRFHKYSQEKDPHRFIYTQLLFYKPWRSADELSHDDFEHCIELYNEIEPSEALKPDDIKRTKLEKVKEKVFPHACDIEKARAILENLPYPQQRPQHIADQLDPENEMDNEEQGELSDQDDEDYAGRDPGEMAAAVDDRGCIVHNEIFQAVKTGRLEDMERAVRQLDPDQRYAYDIIIKYCKTLRKCMKNPRLKIPPPPKLVVHGGAGCGKSKLIEVMSQWAEHILRTNNNKDPSHPFVLRTAPTGSAAHNIDGLTFHSAFNFPFGNSFSNLGANQRKDMRNSLQNLTVLIIDEMSMVKSDLLYQLHLRLCEITQNYDFFGGISVVLCGDLMQLRPIQANWIFDDPRGADFKQSHDIQPLWELFKPIELRYNHRQGNDKTYADLLNRVRCGNFTKSDIKVLKSRVTDTFPSNAVYVFGKRKLVKDQNLRELNKLPGQAKMFPAVQCRATHKRPKVNKAGFINDTPFMDVLEVKLGARVMMTYNCNTADGLTNGATGVLRGFLTNNGGRAVKDSEVSYILVEFDSEKIGQMEREKFKHLLSKCPHKKATPVPRVKFAYRLGKANKQHAAQETVIQFPLTLAWAMTAHKCQGQTIKAPTPLVADLDSVFSAGQAYVILGRVQNVDQLYLKSFSVSKIMIDQNALREANHIQDCALNVVPNRWTENNRFVRKISCLNIRSLKRHITDLSMDSTLLHSDFICLQETWMTKDHALPILNGYKLILAGEGRGKGVAIYVKQCHANMITKTQYVDSDSHQLLKIVMPEFDLINIYRSPSADSNRNFSSFIDTVTTHISAGKSTIICGDINVDYMSSPTNNFSKTLRQIGFRQIINNATHLDGAILDHCYIRSAFEIYWTLHCPYYSDHDALNIIVKKNLNK